MVGRLGIVFRKVGCIGLPRVFGIQHETGRDCLVSFDEASGRMLDMTPRQTAFIGPDQVVRSDVLHRELQTALMTDTDVFNLGLALKNRTSRHWNKNFSILDP
jgi:hypothetical protein